MPRGVKGSGPKKKAKAPAAAPQVVAAPAAPPAAAAEVAVTPAPDESSWRPLGSVDVDSLTGEALKAYARRAGLREADIDFLTEDRLRQNVKLAIANHFELLSE